MDTTMTEYLLAERYQYLMGGLKDWETKTREREKSDGRKRNYRIPRLRTLFAVGLGRPVPVSQAEFSFWCGMSRDVIAAVESGKTNVTAGLAGRIYDLTCADLSWLNGKADEESYDYSSLQAWFPKTMPLTSADIKRAHFFPNHSCFRDLWAILEPLARSWYRHSHGESVKWPSDTISKIFAPYLHNPTDQDPAARSPYPPLWEAFAFAPSSSELRVALNHGMLDDCPSGSPACMLIEELKSESTGAADDRLCMLSNSLIHTLSRYERGKL